MTRPAVLLACALVGLCACGDDDEPTEPRPDAGDGGSDAGPDDADTSDAADAADAGPSCTTYLWDPDGETTTWPDPRLVRPDPTTATGLRLHFDPAENPTLAAQAGGALVVFTEGLADLDGFGVNAEVYFRFDRAFDPELVPTGTVTASPTSGIGIVALGEDGPRIVPVIVRTADDDTTLLLAPTVPLPEQSLVAAFVTTRLTPAAGGCLAPSADLERVLGNPEGDMATGVTALESLGIIEDTADIVSLVVYRTQSITAGSELVAADIAGRTFAAEPSPVCIDETEWIRCEGAFMSADYRDEDGVVRVSEGDASPRAMWRLPYTVWLPPGATPPYPTILFGHGLGSGREQAGELAGYAAPRGIATIAIDAMMHGQHPSRPDPTADQLTTILSFFAIGDPETRLVDALRHRDHWRQSTYDKLQLTQLLLAGIDADGDGTVDLDPDRLTFLGASLGGIMGPELLALTDAYGAAVLAVPGSRVAAIISDSALIGGALRLLAPRGTSEGDIMRFIPVFQTVIDRGDSGSYGPHIFADRLRGERVPSVLAGIALDDEVVPNVCNYALTRSIGLPIVGSILRAEPAIEVAPMAPVSGNVAGGMATAGFLQFDVVREGTEVVVAEHDNVPGSEVGAAAWFEFLDSHFRDGLARIIDPYVTTDLAHAPPGGSP